ncbi:hypothetical protein DLAC_05095 [Tieghemostelium lacteum]|uniref:Metallophosphoesterase TT1561-like domain-containing protein n=1 Tax=Tieghemostelium lacteum TaxID=361077 RepID=A0A151ZI84_TIELA|nr:hypothetical protein DLAC_05095 [Tieghemostelium lacteum]|eukprot:KYQ93708.1 hypothetical protein DLAC_05095 [Tieghemostelium lacteum]
MENYKYTKNFDKKSLKILIASDIHLAIDNIKKLGETLERKIDEIDYVFLPGDLCNFDPKNCDNSELVSACEGEMSSVISAFENIFYKKTIYLPGNHDAKTTLLNDVKPKLTSFSENIHKQCFRIHNDIVMVGLGGSLPGYQDGKERWVGYPYQSEDQVEKDLKSTVQAGKDSGLIKETDKILLFTHMGPYYSATTIDQVESPSSPIYSGSKSINSFILANQSKILLSIHGHTHHSLGMNRVGKTYVVNPGSLRTGHYAILTLEKYLNELWRVKSTEYHIL